jgi:hypothetical protein
MFRFSFASWSGNEGAASLLNSYPSPLLSKLLVRSHDPFADTMACLKTWFPIAASSDTTGLKSQPSVRLHSPSSFIAPQFKSPAYILVLLFFFSNRFRGRIIWQSGMLFSSSRWSLILGHNSVFAVSRRFFFSSFKSSLDTWFRSTYVLLSSSNSFASKPNSTSAKPYLLDSKTGAGKMRENAWISQCLTSSLWGPTLIINGNFFAACALVGYSVFDLFPLPS